MPKLQTSRTQAAYFLGSIVAFKAYRRPMLGLVVAASIYAWCAFDRPNLQALVDAQGETPAVALVALVLTNLLLRVVSAAAILMTTVQASTKTWLPAVIHAGLAYVAMRAGMPEHALMAAVLAVASIIIAWIASGPGYCAVKQFLSKS